MSRWFLLPIALGLLVWFALLLRRFLAERRSQAETRAHLLDLVPLQAARSTPDPSGYPRRSGTWRGQPFDLRLIPDSLTFRKLPALWLQVTLTAPQPIPGEARLMARATGMEPFSTFSALPQPIALPPGFPPHCTLRATGPAALPPPATMAALAEGFTDPTWKEAVIGARGLRLVVLAEEADRSSYLIYRDATLGRRPIPASTATALMDRLITLSESLHAR